MTGVWWTNRPVRAFAVVVAAVSFVAAAALALAIWASIVLS